jgi:hypothetical protein
MQAQKSTYVPKAQMKCNHCKKGCLPKNGDWFLSGESSQQQIFLCKPCESTAKGSFKRVNTNFPR